MNFIFTYIGNVIIPTDFHIFQRGGSTTNQKYTVTANCLTSSNMKQPPGPQPGAQVLRLQRDMTRDGKR